MFIETRPHSSTPDNWADTLLWDGSAAHWAVRLAYGFDPRWHAIRQRLDPGARVLDVGAGRGEYLWFLGQKGYEAVGLDYSEELVRRLEEAGFEAVQGPAQDMPVEDESFDAVISWGVVEHDPEGPEAAFSEIRRALKPGGYTFLTVPLHTEATKTSSRLQFPEEEGSFFQYFFTPAEFSRRLEDSGFRVEETRAITPHISICFPRFYHWVTRQTLLVQRACRAVLLPYMLARRSSRSMLLAVARKP